MAESRRPAAGAPVAGSPLAPTSSNGGGPTIAAPMVTPAAASTAPMPEPARRGAVEPPRLVESESSSGRKAKRYKARQVQRVITRVDPWSVLKVSLLFAVCLWLILVVAGVILWRVAVATGTIGRFEEFMAEMLAENTFVIDGGAVLRGSALAGVVLLGSAAVFSVIGSVLFNLIAALTGGVRTTVVELETARPVDGA